MKTDEKDKSAKLLIRHISGGNAFIKIEEILEGISYEQVGIEFPGLPYSFWQLFEHLRIAQKDILDFSTSSDYKEIKWPDAYWPKGSTPDSAEHWEQTKQDFFRDRDAFNTLLYTNPDNFMVPFPHGTGQNLFREALLILEHNAYHTGQLMILSRLLDSEAKVQ